MHAGQKERERVDGGRGWRIGGLVRETRTAEDNGGRCVGEDEGAADGGIVVLCVCGWVGGKGG